MPPRSPSTTQDDECRRATAGWRSRLPDTFVEPFARASARLVHERVLADPLEFKSFERRDEIVLGTIKFHVRPEDRRIGACSRFQNGVGASATRARRK